MPTVGQIEKGKLLEYRSCGENRYIWLACPDCGKEKWVMLSRAKRQGYIIRCRGCAAKLRAPEQSQRMTGSGNYQWKGGRHKTSQGYISVWVPPDSPYYKMARKHKNKRTCVLEHRLVIAQFLGRCLEPWEIVHHFNGMKDDNRIENLFIVNKHIHERWTIVKLLQKEIRLLQWQVKELTNRLNRIDSYERETKL